MSWCITGSLIVYLVQVCMECKNYNQVNVLVVVQVNVDTNEVAYNRGTSIEKNAADRFGCL